MRQDPEPERSAAVAANERTEDLKDVIRQFIVTTCLPGESPEHLRDTTALQTSGILDSLALLELVSFLQQRFAIELDVYDTSVEKFDRIEDIAAAVARKRALRARGAGGAE